MYGGMHTQCTHMCMHRCYHGLDWTTGPAHMGGGVVLFLLALSFHGAMRGVTYDQVLFASIVPIFYFSGWAAAEQNTTGVFDWHGFLWPIAGVLALAVAFHVSGVLNVCKTCNSALPHDTLEEGL